MRRNSSCHSPSGAVHGSADAPTELGEIYEAAYNLVAAGNVLPFDGRWITGEEMPV